MLIADFVNLTIRLNQAGHKNLLVSESLHNAGHSNLLSSLDRKSTFTSQCVPSQTCFYFA